MRRFLPLLALLLHPLLAPGLPLPADWTAPVTPFKIAGNLFYVGSRELAAYLIVTPEGNILL